MNWDRLLPLDFRRKRLLAKQPAGAMADYLAKPFPLADGDYRQTRYLAIDLETNGLDADTDHILSAGWVAIDGEDIDLASARHYVIQSEQPLAEQGVVIHGLTDDTVAGGLPLKAVMEELLQQLHGKVLLAHYARVEIGFLNAACRHLYGCELLVPVVDTLYLARQRLQRRDMAVESGTLRLAALREQYGLPRYRAHDALSDALACAELFLALAAESAGRERMPLKALLGRS